MRNAMWWVFVGCTELVSGISQAEAEPPRTCSTRFAAQVAYEQHCSLCHQAKPSDNHTDVEWRMIVQRMGPRARLSDRQREAVLSYLQSTN